MDLQLKQWRSQQQQQHQTESEEQPSAAQIQKLTTKNKAFSFEQRKFFFLFFCSS
jgi:hypothetical protein